MIIKHLEHNGSYRIYTLKYYEKQPSKSKAERKKERETRGRGRKSKTENELMQNVQFKIC